MTDTGCTTDFLRDILVLVTLSVLWDADFVLLGQHSERAIRPRGQYRLQYTITEVSRVQ